MKTARAGMIETIRRDGIRFFWPGHTVKTVLAWAYSHGGGLPLPLLVICEISCEVGLV